MVSSLMKYLILNIFWENIALDKMSGFHCDFHQEVLETPHWFNASLTNLQLVKCQSSHRSLICLAAMSYQSNFKITRVAEFSVNKYQLNNLLHWPSSLFRPPGFWNTFVNFPLFDFRIISLQPQPSVFVRAYTTMSGLA